VTETPLQNPLTARAKSLLHPSKQYYKVEVPWSYSNSDMKTVQKIQKDKIFNENVVSQWQTEKIAKFYTMVKCVSSWPAHFKNGQIVRQSGKPAHVSPTPRVTSQEADIVHRTLEAVCWFLVQAAWVLGQQRCEQPPQSWSIQQQGATIVPGAAVLTPASLILSSTTPSKLWLDACVLHQRTIFPSSQASNLLSLVAKKPHCLYSKPCHGVWTSAPLSSHPFTGWKHMASQIETPICTRLTTLQFQPVSKVFKVFVIPNLILETNTSSNYCLPFDYDTASEFST